MRRLYFLKSNGQVIWQSRTDHIGVRPLSIEEEMQLSRTLSEYNKEEIDVIEIGVNEYAQDFAESIGYRVNPETKQLEFFYPDPNEPEAPPVYQKPLSEEVAETKQAIAELTILLAQMGGM